MNEAELRAQIKAEVLAELRAEKPAGPAFDFSRQVADGHREDAWARTGQGAPASANAEDYGAVLALQMLAGRPGTGLGDDGFDSDM